MKPKLQKTFYLASFEQYNFILKNEEIRNIVAGFLLKYVSLEAFYKKLLIAEKEKSGKKLSQKEKNNLGVASGDVRRVMKYYDIQIDDDLIERVFGSLDNNYMECSIKKLRNRLVHNVNESVLRVIVERADEMNKDLDDFITAIHL